MFYIIKDTEYKKSKYYTEVYRQEYKPVDDWINYNQKPTRVLNLPKKLCEIDGIHIPGYANFSLKYMDVLSWGYYGSGPNLCSFSLIFDFCYSIMKLSLEDSGKTANQLNEYFKKNYIRRIPQDGDGQTWMLPFAYMELMIGKKDILLKEEQEERRRKR